jgi:hypothetical protein
VQVVEGDAARPQTTQALLDLGPEHVRPPFPGAEAAFRPDDAILGESAAPSVASLWPPVGGVDVPHSGGDRLLHEGDLLGRVREPIRPESDPGDLGVAELERRCEH